MIKGLSEYEKYKVLRPVVGEHQLDENGFPIINKTEFHEKEWQNIGVTGLQNASPKKKNDNMVLLMLDVYKRQHSEYVGSLKETTLREMLNKHPERVIESAVKGMLPKGPLGREMYTKLHVYAGPDHKHEAQKPEVLTF